MGEPAAVSSDARPPGSWTGVDSHLRWLLGRLTGPELAPLAEQALEDASQAARGRIGDLHRALLDAPPALDGAGGVTVPAAARELEREARNLGLVAATYTPGWRHLTRRAPRSLTAAVLLALAGADRAVAGGSLLVTDAVCRTLERHDPALAARWVPHLTGAVEPAMTASVLLTEAGSGADLGLIETVAVPDGTGGWRVTGEKSCAANAGADLALVLARPQEAAGGTRGLALFAVPRRLQGGAVNGVRVEALRPPAGLPGLPIGRVRLAGARGRLVGRPGRGFRQAMDAITVTRILLGVVAAAIARQAAEQAWSRAPRPGTVGDEPRYREQLAEWVVDAVAATTGALIGADVLQRTDHGRLGNDGSLRLLAPLLKRTLSDLARNASARAIRLAGGAAPPAERRLLDDAIAVSAWEGSSDTLALEVVRAADQGHATALFADLERRLGGTGAAPPLAARLLDELARQRAELEELALLDEPVHPLRAAQLADRLALLTLSSFLVEQAGTHAEETGSGLLPWIAARFASRL